MLPPNPSPGSISLSHPALNAWGAEGHSDGKRSAAEGREAPLDLIEEHLTDIPFTPGRRPAEVSGKLLAGWSVPADYRARSDGSLTPVCKVQAFAAGGFEATVRLMDLEKIGNAIDRAGQLRGKREAPEEQDRECVLKAAARAKRKVRYLVKNMGATHLCTLTKRETAEDVAAGRFWGSDDWLKAWDRMKRNLERLIGHFPYVAILERHSKGNFHLHIAWVGKINLSVMRPLWLAICGGRGMGNVDAQYIKVRQGLERSDRIARYISKYVTKSFEEDSRFNKKRYWSSKQTLEPARRYVLRAEDLNGGITEAFQMFGYSASVRAVVRDGKFEQTGVFVFPDGSGVWWCHIPGVHDDPIPF